MRARGRKGHAGVPEVSPGLTPPWPSSFRGSPGLMSHPAELVGGQRSGGPSGTAVAFRPWAQGARGGRRVSKDTE